jgi:hypothetical protein
MKSFRQVFFGKKNLKSYSRDELRRLLLLGEHQQRSLERQIEDQEKSKEHIFKSATQTGSSDRQKRFAAERIASIERTIQNLDRNIRLISTETQIARRLLELKDSQAIKSKASILDRISIDDLVSIVQGDSIERVLREENYLELLKALELTDQPLSNTQESPQVLEIYRQICEVAEQTLATENAVTTAETSVLKSRDSRG